MKWRGKTKYYLRKPKGEIVKDILAWLLLGGAVTIAATSPYFISNLFQVWKRGKRFRKKSVATAFSRLQREGSILIEKSGHDVIISLTKEGRKKAGWLQINALEVKKPKRWDENWRFLMFDIRQFQRWKRDALRSFLRRLGFVQFQKSVWLHAYDCRAEVELLTEFLDLSARELKLLLVKDIGGDEEWLRKRFRI